MIHFNEPQRRCAGFRFWVFRAPVQQRPFAVPPNIACILDEGMSDLQIHYGGSRRSTGKLVPPTLGFELFHAEPPFRSHQSNALVSQLVTEISSLLSIPTNAVLLSNLRSASGSCGYVLRILLWIVGDVSDFFAMKLPHLPPESPQVYLHHRRFGIEGTTLPPAMSRRWNPARLSASGQTCPRTLVGQSFMRIINTIYVFRAKRAQCVS